VSLHLYSLTDSALITSDNFSSLSANTAIWYDLLDPTKEEERLVESHLHIEIPTRDELHEIELSNRLYRDHNAVYCTTTLVTKTLTPEPETHAVSFILKGDALVTLRYSDPYAFKHFTERAERSEAIPKDNVTLLLGLMEAIINRLADILEISSHQLDSIHRSLFRPSLTTKKQRQASMPDFEELLREVGVQGDLLSKIRESLLSLTRVLSFVSHTNFFPDTSQAHITNHNLVKDITALSDQAMFLSSKVSFLLDASLGLVGLQQTAIIKIFSVASVVFLPPTLVASLYGMNFTHMPELTWKAGYPLAIVLMVLSAFLPYLYFKKKKWL
jgi:magnesium transporter